MQLWWKISVSLMILWMFGPRGDTTKNVKNADPDITTTALTIPCPRKPTNEADCGGKVLCPLPEDCSDITNCHCMDGYSKYPNGNTFICDEINECQAGNDSCGAHTGCRNLPGGFYCLCNPGFRSGNKTYLCPVNNKTENRCTDIDECKESLNICGRNSNCNNTIGSYKCSCQNGFINISNTCEVKCKSSEENPPCDAEPFSCKLKHFTSFFTPSCSGIGQSPSMNKLLDHLDDLISSFSYTTDMERLQKVGDLLQKVEDSVQNLAILAKQNMSEFNKQKDINIEISSRTSMNKTVSLHATSSIIELNSSGNADSALLGCLEYSNISHLLKGANLSGSYPGTKKFKLVSPVVTAFLGVSSGTPPDQPILLHLNLTEEVKSRKLYCVFWSLNESAWSTEGCTKLETNGNRILCSCTHLTSFAILMALHDFESWPLTLITKIGLSLSIICLALSIMTFCCCRSLRGTRNTIHMHLCISLFFANVIFLLGITAYDNKILCGIIAGLLHGFYLASFCWMALEGLELYLMLVTVFHTHLKVRYLLAVGYGVPVVIIIISAAVNHKGYGTPTYCWLSREDNFIWSFLGPVCLIILVTCAIFVLTVWKLAEKMTSINPEQGKLKRIRTLTLTSVAQLCILGCCWIFGIFMFSEATLYFAYPFTILNTLQGVMIFLLHCLMHNKVRADYMRWLCAITHFKSPVYSEFSDTNTQTKGKTSKESGL
ncbi:adhesion G protein-coupled receptor E5 isoform X2 [Mixophyes fleayi]|uniref:adhesion G protein-coupled receptor E5 isoform X2 n=1 Tax=Mixophyes fleayi TaxID=3061075 RepID=UPI003F4DF4B7